LARDYFTEVAMRNTELLSVGYRLYQLEQVYNSKGEQAFNDRKNNLIKGLADFYKDFNANVDKKVFEQLIHLYATKSPKEFLPSNLSNINASELANDVYNNSKLASYNSLKELLTGDLKTVIANLNADKGFHCN
jgi:hypothetical protein